MVEYGAGAGGDRGGRGPCRMRGWGDADRTTCGQRGGGLSPDSIVSSVSAYSFCKHVLMRLPLNTLMAETRVSSASSSRFRLLSANPIILSEVASLAELSRNATFNCTH